jgi:predicted transcriptional regulator
MTAMRTYSVRLDDAQREMLESRAEVSGLTTGELIRVALREFLREEEERDYLAAVEERIAASFGRLGRQIEKDRAEQQIVIALLDHLREWLAFTIPSPADKQAANQLLVERNQMFLDRLPSLFVTPSKAKVTAYLEANEPLAKTCPVCGAGNLRRKEGKKGAFWYCSNWNSAPKCDARYRDLDGQPELSH